SYPEILGEALLLAALAEACTAGEIDLQGDQLLLGLRRRRTERCLARILRPRRLDALPNNRPRHPAAGRGAHQRAPPAIRTVVAGAPADGDGFGEADDPSVVRIVTGAGLAADIGRKLGARACRAAGDHALQHGLELVERRPVAGGEPFELWFVGVDRT